MPRRFDDDPRNLDRGFRERKPSDEKPDPDGRQKKSWREVDQMRDGSLHRDDRPSAGQKGSQPRPESRAYRSYKSQLNKLFDGGVVPDALKAKVDDGTADAAKAQKTALAAITAAKSPKARAEALAEYQAEYGFPQHEETLVALLEIADEPQIVVQAIETIETLLDDGHFKRTGSLKARVKTAKMTIDDDDVFAACARLLKRL